MRANLVILVRVNLRFSKEISENAVDIMLLLV
jgi:hypothetical protein